MQMTEMNKMGRVLKAQAVAEIDGIKEEPFRKIRGITSFTQTKDGVLVAAEVWGLPTSTPQAVPYGSPRQMAKTEIPAPAQGQGQEASCSSPIFAFHIHDEKGHYNPQNCLHPYHAGDLPPLFGNQGYALQIVLTDRFTVKEIMGLMVVIHEFRDDFMTQPSGNPGKMIASGIIEPVVRHSGDRLV